MVEECIVEVTFQVRPPITVLRIELNIYHFCGECVRDGAGRLALCRPVTLEPGWRVEGNLRFYAVGI